jgi:hypothetical protein
MHHLPPQSIGERPRARAVHRTLTLHKSQSQFPVGTSKKRPPGDSQRTIRSDISQGYEGTADAPAKVPIRLDAGRLKGVTGVQMARMLPLLALVTQSGSGASHLGRLTT